jgi:hypothetical protein
VQSPYLITLKKKINKKLPNSQLSIAFIQFKKSCGTEKFPAIPDLEKNQT